MSEERYFKFENLMADLAAYLVSEYDIEPTTDAGIVFFRRAYHRTTSESAGRGIAEGKPMREEV